MVGQSNQDSLEQSTGADGRISGFLIRSLLLIVVIATLMFVSRVNIGAIGQGLAYSMVGVAVFLTFRILNFPDLTVDGAFPIGGAVCATLIISGFNAELSLIAAFIAGALTGLVTAIIHVMFKIEGLLASIIVLTGAYTITLRIMGNKSNIPLFGEDTILSRYQVTFRTWLVESFGDEMRRQSNNMVEIAVFFVIVVIALLLLNWFLHTEIGLTIRATGKNSQMVRALGINHHLMITIGLMVSNGLAGLAGALAVQQLGFADVSLGLGLIIRGLAAVIIGEVLLRPQTIGQQILSAVAGMLVFDISRAWVFSALDLPPSDVRLVSALVVLIALAAPNIHDRYRSWRKKQQRKVA